MRRVFSTVLDNFKLNSYCLTKDTHNFYSPETGCEKDNELIIHEKLNLTKLQRTQMVQRPHTDTQLSFSHKTDTTSFF